ncbi:MAG: hypothetical protein ABJF10_17415 [Chthoniobacter sp.]|uniref:hypothetical protein n=1 Tax=Chthoniobacter sp. TaxID=2510640 RepID=UPI0032A5356E
MMPRFLLFLVLAMCAVVPARAQQDLFNPLAVGLRWDVDVEMQPKVGAATHGTAVREITGTEKVNNYTYFVVLTSFTGLPTMKDFTMYRRKSARGVYSFAAIDKDKLEHLEVVLPMTVGQSWKTLIFGRTILSTVEAKETVKIGDKTYENCMKTSYQADDKSMSGTYYQAPDVGNVQEETKSGDVVFKFTLKKFSGLK